MIGQNEQLQVYQERFRFIQIVIVATFIILFARLWYLQIIQGEEYKKISEENRLKKVVVPAPRGMIFDRERRLLVDNQPTFNLTITPQYFYTAERPKRIQVVKRVAEIIGYTERQIERMLIRAKRQPKFQPIIVKKNLSMNEVGLIEMEKLDFPGVDVDVGIRRTNVYGDVGAHVIGYISKINDRELPKLNKQGRIYERDDYIGKKGLEEEWEPALRGKNGVEYLEVDAFGRKKTRSIESKNLLGGLTSKSASPGKNLVLTIDQDLQMAAAKVFQEKERTGAVVAIDPSNGEVLAMLSWPSFDSTEFSVGIDPKYWASLLNNPDKPLRAKSIQDHYPPGSAFKIISSIAGLEEGIINGNTVWVGGGKFRFGGRDYHEHKRGGFGATNVVKALRQSVDVFYYRLGTKIDIDVLAKYARMLGFGDKTDIRLPDETPGIVPSKDWKKRVEGTEWFPGETLSVIIGQGATTATIVQMANMIAAVANGGTLYRPRVVRYVESPDGEVLETFQPQIIRRNQFKESTMKLVRRGLYEVMTHKNGTGRWANIPGIEAAGKTSTIQVKRFTKDQYYTDCKKWKKEDRHHGMFVVYAPIENPKIAVAAVAEHSCSGSGGAAPIAMEVVKTYLSKTMPDQYGPEILEKARNQFWQNYRRQRDREKLREQEEQQQQLGANINAE